MWSRKLLYLIRCPISCTLLSLILFIRFLFCFSLLRTWWTLLSPSSLYQSPSPQPRLSCFQYIVILLSQNSTLISICYYTSSKWFSKFFLVLRLICLLVNKHSSFGKLVYYVLDYCYCVLDLSYVSTIISDHNSQLKKLLYVLYPLLNVCAHSLYSCWLFLLFFFS